MAKENLFLKNAREKGLIDDREIAFAADVVSTNGNSGRAWFFLNGDKLFLYEMRGMADLGAHIETLDLSKAKLLKASSFVLGSSLKLSCGGETYTLKGFAQAKRVIECVREACKG